jgi:hypothetical protein
LLLSLRNEQKENKPAIKHTAPPPVSFPGPLAIASPSTGAPQRVLEVKLRLVANPVARARDITHLMTFEFLLNVTRFVQAAGYWPHLRLGMYV